MPPTVLSGRLTSAFAVQSRLAGRVRGRNTDRTALYFAFHRASSEVSAAGEN
jgi:hypothetical protein